LATVAAPVARSISLTLSASPWALQASRYCALDPVQSGSQNRVILPVPSVR
jgi:hypothetical protein